jgi:hypothetical protein
VFDVVAATSAAIIAFGQSVIHLGSRSGWHWKELVVLVVYAMALVALIVRRRTAYTQRIPWLVGGFSAASALAFAVTFWSLSTLWFVAATTGGSMVFIAAVLRRKPLSEPVTLRDIVRAGALAGLMLSTAIATEWLVRLDPGILGERFHDALRGDSRDYIVGHPYIGHRYRPGSTLQLSHRDFDVVQHNDALGFRNAWPWPERADIIVLGDSVVTGYGVADDDAWPVVLARSLSGARVVNLAQGGAAPQQSRRIYETFGVRLEPKLVLVGVHVQDDFWDADMFDRWLRSGVGGNYVVWRDFAGRPDRPSVPAWVGMHAYEVVNRFRLYKLIDAVRMQRQPPSEIPIMLRLPDGSRVQLLQRDFAVKSAAAVSGTRSFQLVLEALRGIHALAARDGSRVLVVFEPGKEEVYLPLGDESTPDPTRALREALARLGIDYLDLGPPFRRRAAAGERLFFPIDRHPNAAGYAAIANLVRDRIERDSMLTSTRQLVTRLAARRGPTAPDENLPPLDALRAGAAAEPSPAAARRLRRGRATREGEAGAAGSRNRFAR